MAETCDQRERNGVGDVGADELRWREPVGIEIDEHHDAERPGADRRERDQKAQKRPGGHGQPRLRALESLGRVRAQLWPRRCSRRLEQHRHAGQGERDAQCGQQQRLQPLVRRKVAEQQQRQHRGRQAARGTAAAAPASRSTRGCRAPSRRSPW